MTQATILHEAEVELWEAVAYYEDKAAGLGLDFEAEIERSIQTICGTPERWPVREDGTRRWYAEISHPTISLPRSVYAPQRPRLDYCVCPLQAPPQILDGSSLESRTSWSTFSLRSSGQE